MASDHPQFDYWYTVLQLELLFLQFLRSQREQHFVSYVESLGKIIPWMFVLDHYHYARWMTVHVRDLLTLENTCPTTHEQFLNGNFVTQKTSHRFSALAHDQVHEQRNAMAKGDGGIEATNKKDTRCHHEQIPSVQKTLISQVKSVTDVIEELANPFSDTGTELCTWFQSDNARQCGKHHKDGRRPWQNTISVICWRTYQ